MLPLIVLGQTHWPLPATVAYISTHDTPATNRYKRAHAASLPRAQHPISASTTAQLCQQAAVNPTTRCRAVLLFSNTRHADHETLFLTAFDPPAATDCGCQACQVLSKQRHRQAAHAARALPVQLRPGGVEVKVPSHTHKHKHSRASQC